MEFKLPKQLKCRGEMKLGPVNMNAAKITRLYLFPMRSWEVQSLCTKIDIKLGLGLGSDWYQNVNFYNQRLVPL